MGGPERVGDYLLFPHFASGGMATIHLGRLVRGGFQRIVVVKRLHPEHAAQPGAGERLLREAQLSSRARSPYVVPAIDVVEAGPELCLVMELVHGVTLARLLELASAEGRPLPPAVVVAMFGDVLRGLHAAHEATGEDGKPLHVVHRDVSPRNILVGSDGLTRVLDFGIAKALGHKSAMTTGDVRGTVAYMAPEILRGAKTVNRRADIYSAGVALWEALTGERFAGEGAVLPTDERLRTPPSRVRPELPAALDAVVLGALRPDPNARTPTAENLALDLEAAVAPAPREDIVRLLEDLAFDDLERLREQVRACERHREDGKTAPPPAPTSEPTPAATASTSTRPPRERSTGLVIAVALIAVAGGAIGIDRLRASNAAPRPSEPTATRSSAVAAPPSSSVAVEPTTTSVTPPNASVAVSASVAASTHRTPPSTTHPKTSRPTGKAATPAAKPAAASDSAAPPVATPPAASTTPTPRPPASVNDPGAERM